VPAPKPPARTLPPLTNRERIIRIVGKIINSPAIAESPFAMLVNMQRRTIAQKLAEMDESVASTMVRDLRNLLK